MAPMLLGTVMLVLLIGVLLFWKVHAIKPLVVLTSVHHMLLLEPILAVYAEVMYHGSACRGSRWGGRIVGERTSALRRGCTIVVTIVVVGGIERPLMEPRFHNAVTRVSKVEFSVSVSST